MPIYEYRCPDCEKVFEAIQKFSDDPITKCRFCSGTSVERLISRSSFVLKGSGWYQTDYARKSPAASSKAAPSDSASPSCAGCPSAKKAE